MKMKQQAERNAKIHRCYMDGVALTEIARRFKLTVGAIQYILKAKLARGK